MGSHKDQDGKTPKSDAISKRLISLPLHLQITREDAENLFYIKKYLGKLLMRNVCYCSKSKLIITGFSGYIGSQLTQFLKREVVDEKCMVGAIEDFISEARCVIHLGASVESTLESLKNNLTTDIELLEIINNTKIPLLCF